MSSFDLARAANLTFEVHRVDADALRRLGELHAAGLFRSPTSRPDQPPPSC